MSDTVESIKLLDGVQYVVEYGAHYRVVFKHHADSTTVHDIERLTGCAGRFGATQEHAAYIEYPIDEVDS